MILLNEKEEMVFKRTKLANLKREYARLIQHPEHIERCIDLKCEIDSLKRDLRRE